MANSPTRSSPPGVVTGFDASQFRGPVIHAGECGVSGDEFSIHKPTTRISAVTMGQPKAMAIGPPLFQPTKKLVKQQLRPRSASSAGAVGVLNEQMPRQVGRIGVAKT